VIKFLLIKVRKFVIVVVNVQLETDINAQL
jgi:hypothetical protein